MTTLMIGGVIIEQRDGQTCGADIRLYRWLEQWLTEDEARALVYSLSERRLIRLVIDNLKAIEAIPLFQGV